MQPSHLAKFAPSSYSLGDRNNLSKKSLVNKSATETPGTEKREYTVTDYITSHLKGTYYVITDSEGMEEVNEEEMRGTSMLA